MAQIQAHRIRGIFLKRLMGGGMGLPLMRMNLGGRQKVGACKCAETQDAEKE